MSLTVTVLDTGSIQPFIFGSNVLRENIGASELVHRATSLWAFEELAKLESNHNIDETAAREDRVRDMYTGKFEADGSDKVGAEVLYAGGGNTVILFQGEKHLERAQEIVYRLSLRLLRDAPGLNLYAAHQKYTWGKEPTLPMVVGAALKQLGRSKGRDLGSLPALGLPVTAACTSTGLPANDRHPDKKGKTGSASRANRQVETKWRAADKATERLRGMFPQVEEARFKWADDLDKLAVLKERDDSYVAVVHADGNGMGKRIAELSKYWDDQSKPPRGYIAAMRELSIRVQETAHQALEKTLNVLVGYLAANDWEEPRQHAYKEGKHYFPVRPIVFGGDDVTLVCAGPWGLAVAQRYLWELEQETLTEGQDDKPYASAGVAIVKTHYPFSQAYHLSEDLIKSAKARSKKLADGKLTENYPSALDWHLTTTGLHGDLETIRQREYTVTAGPLSMRPIILFQVNNWRNWDTLVRLVAQFGEAGDWQERRNKTFRLREALRGGPDKVAEFWAIFKSKPDEKLPEMDLGADYELDNGWAKKVATGELERCVYFDAIEIGEHFFQLPEPIKEAA